MGGSQTELSSATMFDAASLAEHMPHSVLRRLCLCGGFSQLQLSPSVEGLVRDSSCAAPCERHGIHDLAKNTREA